MRSFTGVWLNLTQLFLVACGSGHLPLDVNGGLREHDKLPVEFAGDGSAGSTRGAAGAAGAPWSGPSASGTGVMLVPPSRGQAVCGDGQIQTTELCDRMNLNGATCASLGYFGGVLLCNPTTCNFDTLMCRSMPRESPPTTSEDAGTDDAG
jgi:hypothetical protein